MKKFIDRFCLDKKFNNLCMAVIELPILIFSLIKGYYSLLFWGLLGLAIINIIIKKVYSYFLLKNLRKQNIFNDIIVDNNLKEDK